MAEVKLLKVGEAQQKLAALREKFIVAEFKPGDVAFHVDGANGGVDMTLKDESVGLDRYGMRVLKSLLRIPDFVYGIKDDPKLQGSILDYCVKKAPEGSFSFRIRDGHLSGVYDAKYPVLTTEEAFEIVTKDQKSLAVEGIFTSPNAVETRILDEDIHGAPSRDKNDVSFGGLVLEANGGISTGEYLWRQVCTNGARRQVKYVTAVKGATREKLIENLRIQSKASMEIVRGEFMQDFLHSADVRVENPAAVIHRLAKVHYLPARIEARLMDKLPGLEKNPTYYDLFNMVTEYGRDQLVENHKIGRRVAMFSSNFLSDMKVEACNHCHKPLN